MLQTNAKTSYLVFVSPDNNHNKFYRMIPNVPDITRFTAEYGRVGAAGMKKVYPISSFDKIYNEKIQKGYIDQSALHQTQVMVKSAYVPTLQPSVDWLINTLLNAANRAFKTEYTISADETPVSKEEHTEESSTKTIEENITEDESSTEDTDKKEPVKVDLNKSPEDMSVEELQAAILAKMANNGPVTEQMKKTVYDNIWHDSLVNWLKSFH